MNERYRLLRTSFPVHPKTANLDAFEVHILLVQCLCANQLGILERSPKRIATEASGPRVRFTEQDAIDALTRLEARELIVWWREIETIAWWTVAENQQTTSENGRENFWRSCAKLLREKPAQVQQFFSNKYGEKLQTFQQSADPISSDSDGPPTSQLPLIPQETGNRKQETGSRKQDLGRSAKRRITPKFVDSVLGLMAEACRDIGRAGPRASCKTNRRMIADTTRREDASLDDWRQIIQAQLKSVRGRPEAHHYLRLSTITRAQRWASLRDSPELGQRDKRPDYAPSDFSRAENRTSRGVRFDDGPHLDPNDEATL